jgi:hypothetical protein
LPRNTRLSTFTGSKNPGGQLTHRWPSGEGLRAQCLAAFELHRLVEKRLHRLGHSLEAMFDQQFQNLLKAADRCRIQLGLELNSITMIAVGHGRLLENVRIPKGNRVWPTFSKINFRALPATTADADLQKE